MFVIKNNETGKYVAMPGSDKSYTGLLQNACRFPTREAAHANACGNEHVIPL